MRRKAVPKERPILKIASLVLSMVLVACAPMAVKETGETERGQVFISNVDILIMESFPVQVSLSFSGELPTPCHQLVSEVETPDKENRIHVNVESRAESDEACIQVLEAFSTQLSIDMQGARDGIHSVYLNGEMIGEFSYPG